MKKQISRLDYLSPYILPVVVGIGDYIAILLSEIIVLFLGNNFVNNFSLNIPKLYFYLLIPGVYIFFLFYTGSHKRLIPFWEVMRNTFYANFYGTVFAICSLYLIHRVDNISRFFVIVFFLMSFILLCLIRQILVYISNRFNILKEPILFIGMNKTTNSIINFFGSNNCFGIKVVSIVDEKNIEKAKFYLRKIKIQTVIIAEPNLEEKRVAKLIESIQPLVKNVLFVPNITDTPIANLEIKRLYTENIVLLNAKNNLASLRSKVMKKVFDLVVGIIIAIPTIPILALLAIWVRLDSKGPIFFNAKRIGKNGRKFTCYKFRSMYMDSDKILADYLAENPNAKAEWDEFQKLHDYDPRVTKAGKIMRKTSLDELPQILNVLKGEMSLVGPRPYLPREIEKMGEYYAIIITTVPGITGYWQVNGRSDVTFAGRLKMDNWYIRNWSVWIDIVLLIKTFKAVFWSKGAV